MEICYGGCNIRTHVGECFDFEIEGSHSMQIGQDGEDRRHGSLY